MSRADAGGFHFESLPSGWQVGRFRALDELGCVVCAVTTRRGPAIVADVEQTHAAAEELTRALGLRDIAYCRQVHGNTVLRADGAGLIGEADAMVTGERLRGLMGRSADCPLILIADRAGSAVGMAHASWRGTVGRIASRLVAEMAALFDVDPGGAIACICPSAGPCCYEVGQDVIEAATRGIGARAQDFFRIREGKTYFDLWAANVHELAQAGLRSENIHVAGVCTICRNDLFPSYRAEGDAAGRFAAVIARK